MPMFKTPMIKDTRRSPEQKRKSLSLKQLCQFSYDECALQYYEIVPSLLMTDPRYVQLSRYDQGDFLRLINLLWLDKGRHMRYPEVIAGALEMEPAEWVVLEKRLLDAKLLIVSPDGLYIVQPTLREQYLLNRQANLNKKRIKSAPAIADVVAHEFAT